MKTVTISRQEEGFLTSLEVPTEAATEKDKIGKLESVLKLRIMFYQKSHKEIKDKPQYRRR